MTRWQLQEAKARLSELVTSAKKSPQEITVRGEPAAVVVSIEEYNRLKGKKGSFVEFMRNSPLKGVDLKIERDRSPGRPVRL
jgi:antitoxin Phd